MPATKVTAEIARDLERLLRAYDQARWPWERWGLKHVIFVKVSLHRGVILETLKGL